MRRLKGIVVNLALAFALAPAPSLAASFITDPISNPSSQWAGIDYWGVQASQFTTVDQIFTFDILGDSKIDLFMQGSSKFRFADILLNGQSIASNFGISGSMSPVASGYAASGPVSLQFVADYNCSDCWGDWFGGYVQVTKATIPSRAPAPAVPEPASWAMMIVGFGLIGGVMRKAKTSIARMA